MTAERVKAGQATRPPKGARFRRGVVAQVSPLTVQIEGSAAVAAVAVPGATYTVGQAVQVLAQEPGVGPAFPVTSTPSPLPATTLGAFTYQNNFVDADTGWQRTQLSKVSRQALLVLNTTNPGTVGQGTTIATLPAGFEGVAGLQQGNLLMTKAGSNGNLSGFAEVYVIGNAVVFFQWVPYQQGVNGTLWAGGTLNGTIPYLTA